MKCIWLVLVLAACSGGGKSQYAGTDTTTVHTSWAADEESPPPYDKAAIGKALSTERAAEMKLEREVSEHEAAGNYDKLGLAIQDLRVRRRFIATLELCEAQDRLCPPRLDEPAWPYAVDSDEDPKLDAPLRFDQGSWQKVAAELHGRACACRTINCIDSMNATIDRLEKRPTDEVQADETSIVEITRARECLFRLRGRTKIPAVVYVE